MTKQFDACLKLVLPQSLEEQITDFLLAHPREAGPFVAHAVDGHGAPESITAAAEEVRGRAQRVMIEVLTDLESARHLVAELKQQWPQAALSYWITTVLEAGRFA